MTKFERFNTDNGIRRATMIIFRISKNIWKMVSIPTTVSGGLQFEIDNGIPVKFISTFQYRQRYQEGYNRQMSAL